MSHYFRASDFLLALVVLFACSSLAHAQDAFARIARHQDQMEKLGSDFISSQRRILALPTTSQAHDLAYDQLNVVGQLLTTANREFSVLTQSMMLAELVTDKRATPRAKRILEGQRDYMVQRIRSASEFTEKTIPRAKDDETSRLLLEARDIFKASVDLLGSSK